MHADHGCAIGKDAVDGGDSFSYGDIPVGVMAYRYTYLVPDRPATPHLDRCLA
jgi:hypothetical protein